MNLDKKTIPLPVFPIFKAPKYCKGFEKKYWFETQAKPFCDNFDFDTLIEEALVVECIDDKECPISADWVFYIVAGCIIAALTDKYIVIPKEIRFGWWDNFERFIWEVLWKFYNDKKNKNKLDRDFMGAVFRLFLPRSNIITFNLDDQHFTNLFVYHWAMNNHPHLCVGTKTRLIFYYIEQVKQKECFLPDKVLDSLDKVAKHSSVMIKIAMDYLERGRLIID